MKTLNGSILSRSSHSGEGFKAQRRALIEKWLDEYRVKKYTINDDFTIDVNGDVSITTIDLKEFPDYIQFGVVKGSFDCELNYLTSLRGVPREVEEDFYCSLNDLTTLEYAPEKVGGDFGCFQNNLISLKGCPREIGGNFSCSDNKVQFTEEDVRAVCKVRGKIYNQ